VVMTVPVRRGDLRDAQVEQYGPGACRKLRPLDQSRPPRSASARAVPNESRS
jgi:hypothetical protein